MSRPVVRVMDVRASPAAYALRDFLARNDYEVDWVEIGDRGGTYDRSDTPGGDHSGLPVCELSDGTRLAGPTIDQLAKALGMLKTASLGEYDLAIIGAGPAGLAAAVYGASEGLRTVVFEGLAPGGQAATSAKIENYLGFPPPKGITGVELAHRAREQARRFGAELLLARTVDHVRSDGDMFVSELSDGSLIPARAMIGATGVDWRQLDVPGVDELLHRGVYYGASPSEAPLCKEASVVIVGGGNSASQAALYYARFARLVTMLVRDTALDVTTSKYLVDRIHSTANVNVRPRSRLAGLEGNGWLRAVSVVDDATGEKSTLETEALFVCIGGVPRCEWAVEMGLPRDRSGYVLTGSDLGSSARDPARWPLARHPFPLETIVPGLFAAGDVRHGSTKRISAAIGEGAMSLALVQHHLDRTRL